MTIQKREYIKTPLNKKQKFFITHENHCVLCETKLEIKTSFEPADRRVKEHAFCPKCKVTARSKEHLSH